MSEFISKIIICGLILCGVINFGNLSPLNQSCIEEKRNINIEILSSNVTIIYGGEKYTNESNPDNNVLIDTRFPDKNENADYTTSGQLKYLNSFPVSELNCISYKVKSRNQTHIALFSSNNTQKTNPWIEIVIGGLPDGLGNIFRRNGVDITGTYNQQQNSLNEFEYRGFWLSWLNGNYKVGVRGERPFMSWRDPNPFKINYIAVDTCCGTIGHVFVEESRCPGINITTPVWKAPDLI